MNYEFKTNAENIPVFKIKRKKSASFLDKFLYLDVWHISLDASIKYPRAWAIKQKPGPFGELIVPTEIIYGEIPEGFAQDIAPEPLLIGHYYQFLDTVFKKISETEYSLFPWEEIEAMQKASRPKPNASTVTQIPVEGIVHTIQVMTQLMGQFPTDMKVITGDSSGPELLPSKATAHPTAVKLLQDDFYWDPTDNLAPFGTDDGWQVLDAFAKKSKIDTGFDLRKFLAEEFENLDGGSLKEWLAAKKNSDFDSEIGNTVVIATTFAQLLVEGRISQELKGFWAQAFKLSKSQYDQNEAHVKRLEAMQKVVETAPN